MRGFAIVCKATFLYIIYTYLIYVRCKHMCFRAYFNFKIKKLKIFFFKFYDIIANFKPCQKKLKKF